MTKDNIDLSEDIVPDIQEIVGLNKIESFQNIETESDFKKAKQKSWVKHTEQYTILLEDYINNSKKNLALKRLQKKYFLLFQLSSY